MGKFKEHGVMLYLSPELYVGFVKLQADKGLGRSYAALLCFVEGLYKLGHITEEVHENHKAKYSLPLVQQKPEPLTIEELKETEKIRRVERQFSMVTQQWNTMKDKAKRHYMAKAQKLLDKVPNAKLVLALANGNEKSIENEVKP